MKIEAVEPPLMSLQVSNRRMHQETSRPDQRRSAQSLHQWSRMRHCRHLKASNKGIGSVGSKMDQQSVLKT